MKSEWPNAFFHRAKSLQDCCCDLRVFNQIDLVNLITEYFNRAKYIFSIPPYLSFKRLPGRKSWRMPPFRYICPCTHNFDFIYDSKEIEKLATWSGDRHALYIKYMNMCSVVTCSIYYYIDKKSALIYGLRDDWKKILD